MKDVSEHLSEIQKEYSHLGLVVYTESDTSWIELTSPGFQKATYSHEKHGDTVVDTGKGFRVSIGFDLHGDRAFWGLYNISLPPDDIFISVGGAHYDPDAEHRTWNLVHEILHALVCAPNENFETLTHVCEILGAKYGGF